MAGCSRRRFTLGHRRIAVGGAAVLLVWVAGYRASRPLDAERLVSRAEEALRARDFERAQASFEHVLRRFPDDARAYDGLARTLQLQPGFPRGAGQAAIYLAAQESVLVRARRERWPLAEHATVLRNHAVACFRLGEYTRAQASLEELQASGGGRLETDLALAVVQQQRGEAAAAALAAQAARRRWGDIEPVWKLELVLRAGCAAPDAAALVGLRNLAAFGPVEPAADACRTCLDAEAEFDLGRFAPAESRWRTLFGGPLAPLAHLGLGRAALRRDAPEEALPHFEAAAAGGAPQETLHYWRAQTFSRSGDEARAREELARAAGANPLATRDGLLLGFVAAAAGDTAAAEAAYQQVLDLDRQHPEALYRLGVLWISTPRRADGRTLLQRYLEAQPEGPRADEIRRLLRAS